ncbi:MAG: MmgE/PrpD family protein [Acidimicrobiales bacterium]
MPDHSEVPAVTRAIVDYAHHDRPVDLSPEPVELAVRSLVDTIGVLLAGRTEGSVSQLRANFGSRKNRSATSTVLFDGGKTDPETAALLNGTAAHALDYDDVAIVTHAHPSAVLWPAISALAEKHGASGLEMIEAYLVGYDVSAAIARGMDLMTHYWRGWHTTSTIGIFGAVAAAGRMLRLNTDQLRCAIGIAGSMAAGSCQNFGTMTKPLHAGLAARGGLFAANLAAHGFTADQDQLEAPLGFFRSYSEDQRLEGAMEVLRTESPISVYGLNFKQYPCCYAAHRAISAALRLKSEHQIDASEIEKIELVLHPHGFESLIHHQPENPVEAKFSGEYAVATALLDGAVPLRSFTPEAIARPAVRRLLELVQISELAIPPLGNEAWNRGYAVVRVTSARGEFSERVDSLDGDQLAGLTRDVVEEKFRDCVEFAAIGSRPDDLLEELWDLPERQHFDGFKSLVFDS